MTCSPVCKTRLKLGDRTVLGTITALKTSPSGKTIAITVTDRNGREFTDRISATGSMNIFS